MSNPVLTQLQQQLAAMQSQVPPSAKQASPEINREDIKLVIKEILSEELGALKSQVAQVAQPKVTLLQALGLVLSIEEQEWLSKPAILEKLPEFIVTDKGKETVGYFMKEFRGTYEGKA